MATDEIREYFQKGQITMAIIHLDNELGEDYLAQSRERLGAQIGAQINDELINRVLQAVHSVKGGAGFFDLPAIRTLAHETEDALALIRSRKMVPRRTGSASCFTPLTSCAN
jgi:chemotaxis protein histidine kinase CheA